MAKHEAFIDHGGTSIGNAPVSPGTRQPDQCAAQAGGGRGGCYVRRVHRACSWIQIGLGLAWLAGRAWGTEVLTPTERGETRADVPPRSGLPGDAQLRERIQVNLAPTVVLLRSESGPAPGVDDAGKMQRYEADKAKGLVRSHGLHGSSS
jgi:hypothetical protein